MDKDRELIIKLLRCNVLRTGNFKLKSGHYTPIYIDLRRIIHYPYIVKDLAVALRAKQIEKNLKTDTVCGVPYTALPIASVFSVLYNIPMVMKRKEVKECGTKRLVEGNFRIGDSCLMIEDIVASGTSIMETAVALRGEGLNVQDCMVVVNKNQGGIKNLEKVGLRLHPLFQFDLIFSVYCSINRIEAELVQTVTSYFKENSYLPIHKDETKSTISYIQRAEDNNNPVSKRLLEIMEEKKSNLCVAIDTNHSHELIKLAEQVGPHICLLKTHIDILGDFSEDLVIKLKDLSTVYKFLILEDRKFSDAGNTVIEQYRNGLYKIQTWADIVTVHVIPGMGTVETLKISSEYDKNACVLVAEMSFEGELTSSDYKEHAFTIAENHLDFVTGYVAQHTQQNSKHLIHMCPYISIASDGSLDSKYKLPEDAVTNGADIIIVGKEISQAADIVGSAIEYKTRSFNAYLKRIS